MLRVAAIGRSYREPVPAFLVHGNPETPAVWDPLRAELRRDDVIAPRLPGFGVPAGEGFGASKEEYVDWLVAELESAGEPVDLVGHDWGGAFALRVACTRPDLLRSWVTDVGGVLDPDFTWHDFAKIWQTPGEGERWVEDNLATPREARVQFLSQVGVTPDAARAFVDASDAEMGRCILALYRSAAQPAMAEWGRDAEAASARPGLVVAPADDPFAGGTTLAERTAQWAKARFEVLEGQGHWWMLADPQRAARLLEAFWASVGEG
jgi:pimeloyl-ACP methyl ester carboxylesterase